MLCWKNKPVDELSELELREALSESMTLILNTSAVDNNSGFVAAFLFGVFLGLFLACAGIVTASLF